MSLYCGNCRNAIKGDYGLLYRLERDAEGNLRYPHQEEDHLPPNSTVCDLCWLSVPETCKYAKPETDPKATVFAHACADSGVSPMTGAKEWSSMVVDDKNLLFMREQDVSEKLPSALQIIKCDAREKIGAAKSVQLSHEFLTLLRGRTLQCVIVYDQTRCDLRFSGRLIVPIGIVRIFATDAPKHALTIDHQLLCKQGETSHGWASRAGVSLTKRYGGREIADVYVHPNGWCCLHFLRGLKLDIGLWHTMNAKSCQSRKSCGHFVAINNIILDCFCEIT